MSEEIAVDSKTGEELRYSLTIDRPSMRVDPSYYCNNLELLKGLMMPGDQLTSVELCTDDNYPQMGRIFQRHSRILQIARDGKIYEEVRK